MTTTRKFQVVYHLNGLAIHNHEFFLSQFQKGINEDQELYYAMDEIIDAILDLNVGESLYFSPNRDCKTSKAIIVRLN